jgi:hypothetical protein
MKIKNKKIVALIIFLAVLLVIPLSLLAAKAILNIPIMDDASIAEANKKEGDRLLSEKEKFAQEHQNKAGTSIDIPQTMSTMSENNDDEIADTEQAKETSKKLDDTANVIRKYYASEFDEITNNLENEQNSTKVVDIKNTPLTENQKRLYNLVIKIIETEKENLSDEEISLLKDFLESHSIEIKNDSELSAKVDEILK